MTIFVRDADDLPDGTRIPCDLPRVGPLTVLNSHFEPAHEGMTAYVEIDVTCEPNADIWDMDQLAGALGAESAWWLANTPQRRYRLLYATHASVPTIEKE